MFKGLDNSLYLDEIIEELGEIEQRRYLRIQGGTDLSRAEFENRATEAGLVLNPPPDVEPFQHFCCELRKDQEENNDDYGRRPSGKEVVVTEIVKNGEEITKEKLAELVKWNQAYREAEDVINTANKERVLCARKLGLKGNAKKKFIDDFVMNQVVFDKAVEMATKHGVSSQLLLDLKQIKHVVKSTKTICTIPNAGQAAAAFCARLMKAAYVHETLAQRGQPKAKALENGGGAERRAATGNGGRSRSEKRAAMVAKIINELNTLKPQMFSESEYEELRQAHPNFVVFKVAKKRPDLRRKLKNLDEHRQHIKFAQELAAAHCREALSTIQTAWKMHKPQRYRVKSGGATVEKYGHRQMREWGKLGGRPRKDK